MEEGEVLATLYSNDRSAFARAEELLLAATQIKAEKPAEEPLIYDIID